MKRKAVCSFLALVLVLSLCACGAEEARGSFMESEVSYPRLVYFARQEGKGGEPYYLPLSPDLAELCRKALDEPEKEKPDPATVVQLFQLELDREEHFTVFETLSGERFFGSGAETFIKADEAAAAMLDRIGEAAGEPCGAGLYDCKAASRLELIREGEVIWSTESQTDINRMAALLDAYQGSSAGNFDRYNMELRCSLSDGRQLSLLLSDEEDCIFLPPLRYYRLPQETAPGNEAWLSVFGWEEWPGDGVLAEAGEALHKALDETENGAENIAAKYKDKTVSWTEVEYARNTASLRGESDESTDKAIVDRLIRGKILVEMAEERGVAATEEEIEAMIENTRLAYELPEGKTMIDEYCRGLEMSFAEYLELLRSQAYESISMQKMRDRLAQDICEEYQVEYSKDRLPEKVQKELERVLNSLTEEHRDDIEYFLP